MKKHLTLIPLLLIFCCILPSAELNNTVKEHFQFTVKEETCLLPCAGITQLHKQKNTITVIIAIHGVHYNARNYHTNVTQCIKRNRLKKYQVLAPQFLKKDSVQQQQNNVLSWEVSPFWGSSKAILNKNKTRISSFDVLDQMFTYFTDKQQFPHLKKIILVGHSGGGQMVQRYTLSSHIAWTTESVHHIKVTYLVMNPSSYTYLDENRPINNITQFIKPSGKSSGYNEYGYGLEKLYSYQRNTTSPQEMLMLYKKKHIIYLLGEKDTTNNGNLSITRPAMLQGPNRLDRGKAYYNHLQKIYGNEIRKTHQLVVVKGVGHSSSNMFRSRAFAKILQTE